MTESKYNFNFLYKLIRKVGTPISYYLGKVSWRVGRKYTITQDEVDAMIVFLEPGDVILTYKKYNLTNFLISGDWDHAALCSSKLTAVEAVGTGVRERSLRDLLSRADEIKVLRSKFCDSVVAAEAGHHARSLIGLPYDYKFKYSLSSNKSFYCSEVIWWSYDTAMGGKAPFKPREVLGELTIIPSDFNNAKNRWSKVGRIGHRG